MTAAEIAALAEARACGLAGRVRYTAHALERRAERRVTHLDVCTALGRATGVAAGRPTGRPWRLTGCDQDGDELDVVMVLKDGVLVVTVF